MNETLACGIAHGADWLKWLGHLKEKPAIGMELGTYQGESAQWMLENIFTHPDSRYYCVDTFEGGAVHQALGIDCSTLKAQAAKRLSPYRDRCAIFTGLTRIVLRHWDLERLDFVYVDAGHAAQDVLRDAVQAWELLNIGGVMVFDNWSWNWMPEAVDNPRMAIEAFLNCYARHLQLLDEPVTQVSVKKTDEN